MLNRTSLLLLVAVAVATLLITPARAGDDLAAAQAAIQDGRFADAEKLLTPLITDADAPITDEPMRLREIMRRIRIDFPLTPEAMLAKLKRSIPDATAADIERWTKEDVLQHRVIDGQTWYFNVEPGNLFRLSSEARARRVQPPQPAGSELDLPAHLARLLKAAQTEPGAQATGSATTAQPPTVVGDPPQIATRSSLLATQGDAALVAPTHHRVQYSLAINKDHPRIKPGAKVRVWLPFPKEYRQQRDVRLLSSDPPGGVVAPNDAPQRTVYFEQTIEDPAKPLKFSIDFEYVCSAYVPNLDPSAVQPYDEKGELFREHTAERPPHIVFSPRVREIVQKVAASEPNPLLRAKRLYRWVCENIRYCLEMEYSTIFNIPEKALTAGKGDCGVQGLTFITLCRAAGIPARWQSGWESLPGSENMHDWCEFYVEPYGWLPADPSYGLQDHPDPAVQEFFFGHLDPYRMIVNTDYARELHPPKTSFRSEPNDFQRGEVEIDGHNLYFKEWDWDFKVVTRPLDGGVAWAEEAFDAIVPSLLAAEKIPGAVVGIGALRDGSYKTWSKAYGFIQTTPQPRPMPLNAIFDMASISKPVGTGSALMLLIQRGDVSLDDAVAKYIPEFDTDAKRDITVKHLMTHTSGLPAYLEESKRKEVRAAVGSGSLCAATREAIRKLDLAGKPGEKYVYSCLNAILCAEIVEKVAGKRLDEYARASIFAPLKLTETGYLPSAALRDRIAPTTRKPDSDALLCGEVHDPLAYMQDGVSGNAGLFSTVADMHRFAQMLLRGGELDGVRFFTPETVELMTRSHTEGITNAKGQPASRGLLWEVYPATTVDGVTMPRGYGHTGYTGVALRIYPEVGYYVIALTNRVHPDDTSKVEGFRTAAWKLGAQLLSK